MKNHSWIRLSKPGTPETWICGQYWVLPQMPQGYTTEYWLIYNAREGFLLEEQFEVLAKAKTFIEVLLEGK